MCPGHLFSSYIEIGVSNKEGDLETMVSIITCTIRQKNIRNVFKNYKNQKFEEKELLIILNKDDMSIRKWKKRAERHKNVSIYQLPERYRLGDCLNFAIEKVKYGIIAKFDDDDYYAPNYLTQAVESLKEHNADVVGKSEFFTYLEGLKMLVVYKCALIAGATLVFKKDVWKKVKFSSVKVGSDTVFKKGCMKHGFKIYVTDKYNFTYVRKVDPKDHTWIISDKKYLRRSTPVAYTKNYKPYVELG